MNLEADNKIEKAKLSDIDTIMVLVERAKSYMHSTGNYQWDEQYPLEDSFVEDIKKGDLYKLHANGVILGFICVNMDQPPEYAGPDWNTPQKSLVIHRMVIAREEAQRGLAQMLMLWAEYLAEKTEIYSIRSDTNSKNKAMLHIFEKLGYNFTGHICLRHKPDLFCCYEKHLKH